MRNALSEDENLIIVIIILGFNVVLKLFDKSPSTIVIITITIIIILEDACIGLMLSKLGRTSL